MRGGRKLFITLPPLSPPRARLVTTTAAAAAIVVLVVARVIFMRLNPDAAKDGSVKVFIVARAISWVAQWHLARAVGKRFRGCRAKRFYAFRV